MILFPYQPIILLNGPPRSGKDTLAENLINHFDPVAKFKRYALADTLKEDTHRKYNLMVNLELPLPAGYYDAVKDTPLPEFDGQTPRQAYIHHSEVTIKPVMGKDYWAKLICEKIKSEPQYVPIITDIGFQEELDALRQQFDPHSIILFRLWREGFDFSNDSRSHVKAHDDMFWADIYGGSVWSTYMTAVDWIDRWACARSVDKFNEEVIEERERSYSS